MRLVAPNGINLGGADAVLYIARFVWWLRPLRIVALVPGGRDFLRRCYRWIAARRHCVDGRCAVHVILLVVYSSFSIAYLTAGMG